MGPKIKGGFLCRLCECGGAAGVEFVLSWGVSDVFGFVASFF